MLGAAYDDLPTAVQQFHDHAASHYQGVASSGGAAHFPARLLRRVFGFPPISDRLTVDVWLSQRGTSEHWKRNFGGRGFQSSFARTGDGCLHERFGPFRFAFRLRIADQRLHWDFARWSLWVIPLPKALGPKIVTHESESEDGAYAFYSHADFPLIGTLINYEGTISPVGAEGAGAV